MTYIVFLYITEKTNTTLPMNPTKKKNLHSLLNLNNSVRSYHFKLRINTASDNTILNKSVSKKQIFSFVSLRLECFNQNACYLC